MSTPFKAAIEENWTLIASNATQIDAQVLARHHVDIAAVEQALAQAEELLALRRKTTPAEARDAAASAERASQDTSLATACVMEALRHARAEGAKRHRGEQAVSTATSASIATRSAPAVTSTAATTRPVPPVTYRAAVMRPAPPVTSTATEASSVPLVASTAAWASSVALAARLGPPPLSPFNGVTIMGGHWRSGTKPSSKAVSRVWHDSQGVLLPGKKHQVASARALLLELSD